MSAETCSHLFTSLKVAVYFEGFWLVRSAKHANMFHQTIADTRLGMACGASSGRDIGRIAWLLIYTKSCVGCPTSVLKFEAQGRSEFYVLRDQSVSKPCQYS